MARRSPEEMLAVLEQQAREDDAFEAPMHALAAMSDAELDDHLRGLGLDPAQLEREALTLFAEASPAEAASALPSAVQAVPQQAGKSSFAGETRRRRPLAVAAWLAAGAAAATAGGALLYSLTRPAPEQPAPPAPSPSPSGAPLRSPRADACGDDAVGRTKDRRGGAGPGAPRRVPPPPRSCETGRPRRGRRAGRPGAARSREARAEGQAAQAARALTPANTAPTSAHRKETPRTISRFGATNSRSSRAYWVGAATRQTPRASRRVRRASRIERFAS